MICRAWCKGVWLPWKRVRSRQSRVWWALSRWHTSPVMHPDSIENHQTHIKMQHSHETLAQAAFETSTTVCIYCYKTEQVESVARKLTMPGRWARASCWVMMLTKSCMGSAAAEQNTRIRCSYSTSIKVTNLQYRPNSVRSYRQCRCCASDTAKDRRGPVRDHDNDVQMQGRLNKECLLALQLDQQHWHTAGLQF